MFHIHRAGLGVCRSCRAAPSSPYVYETSRYSSRGGRSNPSRFQCVGLTSSVMGYQRAEVHKVVHQIDILCRHLRFHPFGVGKSSASLLAGVKAGAFTCVGRHLTLCDPIWQLTFRRSRTSSRRGLYSRDGNRTELEPNRTVSHA